MSNDRLWLPALLYDLREAFGEETALRLARHYGGRKIYVPSRPLAEHYLARTMGVAVLAWLVSRTPGQEVLVPMATASHQKQREAEIRHYIESGADVATIVARFGIHERTVQRLRAKWLRPDGRQVSFEF